MLPTLDPSQVRMGRAALNWTRAKLSAKSGIAEGTIKRVEEGNPALLDTIWKIRHALEEGGVEFGTDGSVRLRRHQ